MVYGAQHPAARRGEGEGRRRSSPSGSRGTRCRSSPKIAGIVKYGDLIEDGVTMVEQRRRAHRPLDAASIIESQGRRDKRPRVSIKDPRRDKTDRLLSGNEVRYMLRWDRSSTSQVGEGDEIAAGDVHLQDPPRDDQDQGHHRWSAPRGRAVRGPQAQGLRHHLGDRWRRSAWARSRRASAPSW